MKDIVKLRIERSGTGYWSYAVTLPKDMVKALGWQKGDRILVELDGERGRIILRKA